MRIWIHAAVEVLRTKPVLGQGVVASHASD
jgi:hypothetical protein